MLVTYGFEEREELITFLEGSSKVAGLEIEEKLKYMYKIALEVTGRILAHSQLKHVLHINCVQFTAYDYSMVRYN